MITNDVVWMLLWFVTNIAWIYWYAIKESEPVEWNVVDFLKSLNKEQMHELLQATSLITDPLGQELIKRASEGDDE